MSVPRHIVPRHLAQFGVFQHCARFGEFALSLVALTQRGGDRFELCVFAREFAEAVVVGEHIGLAEQEADFFVAFGEGFELAADRWRHGESVQRRREA